MADSSNTQFAIGVHVLTLLSAFDGQRVSSEVLAGSAGSNPVHVRRILGKLREAGLVDSVPGPGGGWLNTRSPQEVDLADVRRALHAGDRVLGVHGAHPDCSVGQQIQSELEQIDDQAVKALDDQLAKTTLADLVARSNARYFVDAA
jgi:Rrf2 family protein